MLSVCKIFCIAVVSFLAILPSTGRAQDYEILFKGFSSQGLTFTERRYLQAALAFEGHYVGLLDGDWGRLSSRAMQRYSQKEFKTPSEEWHTAVLAFSFYDRYERDGWDMQYFPALGMSIMLPQKSLINDPPSKHLVNFRHLNSSLAVSVGIHSNETATKFHTYTLNAHTGTDEPYTVRKSNFAISTATLSDGSKLYSRSNFIDGAWSTIMVSAKSWDINTLHAVTSSIAKGRSPALDITKDGKLIEIVRKAVALAKLPETDEQSGTTSSAKAEPSGRSGSGFVVSVNGHVLTNAHVVDECSEIFVDGVKASLVDSSNEFDLALLQTSLSEDKIVAVFSASAARLNSDVTAVGYPYAGLLGGMNVTRGSVSSLKGLGGDSSRFQISAPVQSGNSGGPLLGADGQVVGVVVSKLDATLMAQNGGDVPQNVNFAIRGGIAKLFLAQNQVDPKLSLDDEVIAPEKLAKTASQFTTLVECK